MATTAVSSINEPDFKDVAEAIHEEWKARKKRRDDLEKQWNEIDRQLKMEPELSHKMGFKNGVAVMDPIKAWMPEVELPLQAQALETILADVHRLRYPSNRDWFTNRVGMTPAYIEAFDKAGNPFIGERGGEAQVDLKQDDADKIVQGFVSELHNVYNFRSHVDLIDAQALAYGSGVGRMRRVSGRILGYNARTMKPKNVKTPILVPRNIRNVFFDDSQHALMHEGVALGPSTIQHREIDLTDLKAAAAEDPGTYLSDEISKLKTDKKNDTVTLIELEGDFVFAKDNETVIVQDVELTVAVGSGGGLALVRKKEGEKFSTYNVHQYHLEGPEFAYASAPLVKGMPVAKAAAQALNRVIESAQLKTGPPTSYSPDDPHFNATGGPPIYPNASWKTADGVTVHDKVGGDPNVMFQVFAGLVQLYENVTGVTPSRLGAQTKSHTTAFAKNIEDSRGQSRTVDYVRNTLHAPMTRLLDLEYRMGLDMMSGAETVFIEEWNEFVEIKKGHLPDIVRFIAIGSDAPIEEQQRVAERIQSAQSALQIDAAGQQMGMEPVMQSVKPMIEQVLREGGWQDIEELFEQLGAEPGNLDQLPGV